MNPFGHGDDSSTFPFLGITVARLPQMFGISDGNSGSESCSSNASAFCMQWRSNWESPILTSNASAFCMQWRRDWEARGIWRGPILTSNAKCLLHVEA
ncbi:hypothetical protein AVEN_102987-1 [Araneus ventricosus]|uniref:Uncharacterized protein n=1 Tax=Araneus ventricosus TaxID=182803 RepID=A0A4Y2B7K9_ARAVE|nr:hypothetical protein AVEN_102987-1 [Araneus ventricosus]